MRIWTGLAVVAILGACGRENGTANAGTMDSGSANMMEMDSGSPYVPATLAEIWSDLAQYSGGGVEVQNVIVVASNSYNSTSTKCTTNTLVQTFYIEDPVGGAGVAVYHACTDLGVPFVNIGDIVTVQGDISKFDGSLQISTYAKLSLSLSVTIVTAGGGIGKATAGAYPPAGMPNSIATAEQADFAYTADLTTGGHPELLGNALTFGGITSVNLDPVGFNDTLEDGGVHSEGFQIMPSNVWVDDSNVYENCIKALVSDGGPGFAPTSVTGMWDRYQDYYGKGPDGGYAPVYPVLVAQSCGDVGVDAGPSDGG